MRYMIIVKANATSESESVPNPPGTEALMASMVAYHEALAQAGVLLDANGLKPSRHGWRIRYTEGRRTVVDGPFAETKELVAGYTLIQVRTRDEAMEWARRFPAPFGEGVDAEIEVRELWDLDDFAPDASLERLRDLERGSGAA